MLRLALAALGGLFAGSFTSALAWRLMGGKAWLAARSRCPHCGHTLGVWELIPLLSYIFQNGRCRTCRQPIPLRYPLTELATALAFFTAALRFSEPLLLILAAVIAILFITASLMDIEHGRIPDGLSLILLLASFTLGTAAAGPRSSLIGLAVGGLPLLFLVVLSRERWMGSADPLLGASLGAALGWPAVLVGMTFAVWLGALVGLALIRLFPHRFADHRLPFAPFLAAGLFLALPLAAPLIAIYLDLL